MKNYNNKFTGKKLTSVSLTFDFLYYFYQILSSTGSTPIFQTAWVWLIKFFNVLLSLTSRHPLPCLLRSFSSHLLISRAFSSCIGDRDVSVIAPKHRSPSKNRSSLSVSSLKYSLKTHLYFIAFLPWLKNLIIT